MVLHQAVNLSWYKRVKSGYHTRLDLFRQSLIQNTNHKAMLGKQKAPQKSAFNLLSS